MTGIVELRDAMVVKSGVVQVGQVVQATATAGTVPYAAVVEVGVVAAVLAG
jgi:hypothetical protein